MRDIPGSFCTWPSSQPPTPVSPLLFVRENCCYEGGQGGQGQKRSLLEYKMCKLIASHSSVYQQIYKSETKEIKKNEFCFTVIGNHRMNCDLNIIAVSSRRTFS
jgi:hypothetical protein